MRALSSTRTVTGIRTSSVVPTPSRGRSGWGARRGGFTFDRSLPPTDRRHCEAADFAGPHRRRPDGRTDLYCVRGAINGTLEDRKLWPA